MHSFLPTAALVAAVAISVGAMPLVIGGGGRYLLPLPTFPGKAQRTDCLRKHIADDDIAKMILLHFDDIAADCLGDVPAEYHERVVYDLLGELEGSNTSGDKQAANDCLDQVNRTPYLQLGLGDPPNFRRLSEEKACIARLSKDEGEQAIVESAQKWDSIFSCIETAEGKNENPAPCVSALPQADGDELLASKYDTIVIDNKV